MAITIDWPNSEILIPREDMTLVQQNPTEIRNLELNDFRLTLKDLEDGEQGITFLKTHIHTTETELGGLTYARVIEILEPYTITFEDGQYAVNLVGANSNVGDRVNVNQVSVRSANSAGLITSSAIEFSEYGGKVTIDPLNRTGNAVSGSVYPTGTLRQPVNNVVDAMVIATAKGFSELLFISDYTLTAGDDVSNRIISGINSTQTSIIIEDAANVVNCEFRNMTIEGVLDGGSSIHDCTITSLVYFNGTIHNSMFNGLITLDGNTSAIIHGCYSGVSGTDVPTIDLGGSGNSLALRNYSGGIELINKTGTDKVSVDISSGQVTLDETIVNGEIVVRGNAKVIDNSVSPAYVDMSTVQIAESSYEGIVYYDASSEYSGVLYPYGIATRHVNQFSDVEAIISEYGMREISFHGTLPLVDKSFDGFAFTGHGVLSEVLAVSNLSADGCNFEQLTLTGSVTGDNMQATQCLLHDLSGFSGVLLQTAISGTMIIGGASLLGKNVVFNNVCTIDMNDTCMQVALSSDSGTVKIENSPSGSAIVIALNSGSIEIGASCDDNTYISIQGNGVVVNNSGATILQDKLISKAEIANEVWDTQLDEHSETGSAGKALSTASSGGVDYDTLSAAVWDRQLSLHTTDGSAGQMVKEVNDIEAGDWELSNNQMIFKDKLGVELFRVNLFNDEDIGAMENVYKRTRA